MKNTKLLNGRYLLRSQLSKGGMGIVFEGFDTLLGASVAIKQCLCKEDILRRAFEREAQLLANLSHRSLPRCIDYFTIGQHQYLVMQLVEGQTAEELLAKYPRGLPIEMVKDFAKQLLDLLEYLSLHLVVHRDIKPSNIKVQDGCVYLLDFGVAYGQIGEMNTVASGDLSFGCHSQHFSPPEQFRDEPPSPAGDVYSFAATLFKLLTGTAPKDAKLRVSTGEKLARPAAGQDDEDFISGIMRGLSLAAKDRPQNASEMRQIMFPDKAKPPVMSPAPQAWRRSKKAAFITILLSLCLLSTLAFPLLKDRRSDPSPPVPPGVKDLEDSNRSRSRVREAAVLAAEAQARLEDGNEVEALKKAARAIELDPENSAARRLAGDIARYDKYDEGDFESLPPQTLVQAKTIREILEKRNRLNGITPSERLDLGWAELMLAKHTNDLSLLEQSIVRVSEVLKLEPNSIPAVIVLADALCEKSPHINSAVPEALIGKLKSVLRARPHYANGYFVRGTLQAEMQHFGVARKDYAASARANPRPAAHYLVAITILQNPDASYSDLEVARGYLEKTLQTNPKFRNAEERLANLYKTLDDADALDIYSVRSKGAKRSIGAP